MANTAITPTRMVLNQLKGRLKTARRGHKLLKDKRDELMRQFLDNVRLNKQLRAKVEQGLTEAFGSLSVASAIMSPEMLEQSLLYPRQSVELGMTYQNIMSVNVPVYDFQTRNSDPSEIFPYGFAQTSGELDDALEKLAEVFKDMLELAQVEKTTQMLAQEIEKTRRRVNALEYVMIPELEQNIRYISMKLDENESSTKVRLALCLTGTLQADAWHRTAHGFSKGLADYNPKSIFCFLAVPMYHYPLVSDLRKRPPRSLFQLKIVRSKQKRHKRTLAVSVTCVQR